MFLVSSDAMCDICMEPYDDTRTLPHSIPCGHIFCGDCLVANPRHNCPTCRAPYQHAALRRLHVDFPPTGTAQLRETARTLQQRFATVIVRGAAEGQTLRQIIDDCESFLRS
ncbi:hypothetical protein FISHEDRAFT_29484, partial [Fistulina hepatica ATCC 64428]